MNKYPLAVASNSSCGAQRRVMVCFWIRDLRLGRLRAPIRTARRPRGLQQGRRPVSVGRSGHTPARFTRYFRRKQGSFVNTCEFNKSIITGRKTAVGGFKRRQRANVRKILKSFNAYGRLMSRDLEFYDACVQRSPKMKNSCIYAIDIDIIYIYDIRLSGSIGFPVFTTVCVQLRVVY